MEPALSNSISQRWSRIKDLYDKAESMPPEEWARYLAAEAPDSAVREDVMRLLALSDTAEQYFEKLAAQIGVVSSPQARLVDGQLLNGRFRIVHFIAAGGMGEVYEAEDLELGGRIAVKVMKPSVSVREGSLQRFRNEIRLARAINNPHICRVFDVARDTLDSGVELIYFTMELLKGQPLAERLRQDGPMAVEDALQLIGQMAEGLHAAHQAGVLHRDFKSGNVMLCAGNEDIRAVITDFGLSQPLEIETESTSNRVDGVTPAYAAPEQLRQQGETRATDVYSFGVVLFEMMTGRLPARKEGAAQLPPESLRDLRPELPQRWEKAILRCLQYDPAKRFQDPLEAAKALGCFDSRTTLSRRLFWPAVAAACAGTAAVFLQKQKSPVSAPHTSVAILELQSDEKIRFVADGIADRISDEITRVPGLRVIMRTATRRMPDASKLEKNFHATHFVSGSLESNGGQYHLNVSLADAGTKSQLWSASYDLAGLELEGVTRQVANGVIHSLLPLLGAGAAKLAPIHGQTQNAEAYRLYLLGRYYSDLREPKLLKQASPLLEQAIQLDPAFAAAHARLGMVLHLLSPKDGEDREYCIRRSNEHARRAQELDPNSAEALLVLAGNARMWDWNWQLAAELLKRAIVLNPNLATAHHWYARTVYPQGRLAEGMAEIELASQLDPFDRSIGIAKGSILLYHGKTRESIEQYKSVAAYDPSHSNVYVPLSCAYEANGDTMAALTAAQRAVALTARASFALAQLGHLYAQSGSASDARTILNELMERNKSGKAAAAEVAIVYSGWKDVENTLYWLERGVSSHDTELISLKVNPQYKFLRNNPRYAALLRQVHLTADRQYQER